MGRPPSGCSTLPGSRVEAKRAGMTTWNTIRKALSVEQRIIRRELTCILFEHVRHVVAYRVCEAVHAAHEHLQVALVLERPLAHGTGENLKEPRIHSFYLR